MEYTEVLIAIGTVLVSTGISWGVMSAKVRAIEKQVEDLKNDHDLIIRLDSKMDGVTETLRELRSLIENKRTRK